VARPGSRAGFRGAEVAAAQPVTLRLGWPVLALGAGAALLLVMALRMPPAVALYLLLCALGGAGMTYLSRLPLRLEERAAFGMGIGAMAATAAGFLAALAIGLNAWSILAGLGVALAVSAAGWRLALGGGELRTEAADLGRRWSGPWRSAEHPWPLWGLLAICWAFALYYLGGGYSFTAAGLLTTANGFYGDWAAHLAYAGSFAYGQNLPPEFPIDPGHRMAYPFLVDFFAAALLSICS